MRRLRELAPGVLVATSSFALSNTVVVAAGDGGCLVIDPGVSVAELAGLAADLAESGLQVRVGFATHPHWDHVLWSRDLGDAPRFAASRAVAILEAERDGMLAQLGESAPGHDTDLVGRVTALPDATREIPWTGPAAQLIVHDGHAPGHAAVFLSDTGVLVAGDMLSDTEIPLLDTAEHDPLGDYQAGMARLGAVTGVRWLVPGHGTITDADGMRRRLKADQHYLDLLQAGQPFDDPRCTKDWMRQAHHDQFRHVRGRTRPDTAT
jgi:hydroxyacylglutathione hydrolase